MLAFHLILIFALTARCGEVCMRHKVVTTILILIYFVSHAALFQFSTPASYFVAICTTNTVIVAALHGCFAPLLRQTLLHHIAVAQFRFNILVTVHLLHALALVSCFSVFLRTRIAI